VTIAPAKATSARVCGIDGVPGPPDDVSCCEGPVDDACELPVCVSDDELADVPESPQPATRRRTIAVSNAGACGLES
jgi:hypothetical protein